MESKIVSEAIVSFPENSSGRKCCFNLCTMMNVGNKYKLSMAQKDGWLKTLSHFDQGWVQIETSWGKIWKIKKVC